MKKTEAFTLVEVLVVVAILGLLAAVGIPSMMNAHQNAQKKSGEINIVSIEAAIDQWAVINNARPNAPVAFTNIQDYLGGTVKEVADLDIGTNRMQARISGGTGTNGFSCITQDGDSMWVGGDFRYNWPF